MDPIRINRKQVRMVAHRGLSGIELENSCAAFVAAGNRDYWGIETDVHTTADGKYIIFHDDTTGRVAATDILVEGSTFDQLRALQLQEVRNGNALRIDLRMPSPEEYFAICKRYGKTAVFELKNPMEQARIAELVAIARREIGLENVVFISFAFQNLVYVREAAPEASCQYLIGKEFTEAAKQRLTDHKMDLDIYHLHVTRELVDEKQLVFLTVDKSVLRTQYFNRPEKQAFYQFVKAQPLADVYFDNILSGLELTNELEQEAMRQSGLKIIKRQPDDTRESLLCKVELHFGLIK